MAVNGTTEADINALREDFAAIRRDISGLVEHLTANAGKTAARAAGNVKDSANEAYRSLSESGEEAATAVARQVEKQPLVALLIALGIGFIGGRVLTK